MCSKILCFRINDDKDLSYCLLNFSKGYLFRGKSNTQWGLTTTLDRKRSKNIEEKKLLLQNYDPAIRAYDIMCANNIKYKNGFLVIFNIIVFFIITFLLLMLNKAAIKELKVILF